MWDFYCEKCDNTTERLVKSFEEAETLTCPTCQTLLTRKAASGGFVVTGYNYKNGYARK